MQIQVNSDNHIQSSKRLEEWVRTTIESTLDRYEEDLTRVEVHLSDENGEKPGPHDLRCQLEARPKGHQPISVTHKADSLEQAIDGAAEKLEHKLDHLFGKLRGKPRAAVVPFTGKANDKLFLAVRAADKFDLTGEPHVAAGDRYQLDVVTPEQLLAQLEVREVGLRRRFELARLVADHAAMFDRPLDAVVEGPGEAARRVSSRLWGAFAAR